MRVMMNIEPVSYRHKVLRARVARAVVLNEFGCGISDWRVAKRTQVAAKACRVFAYIADDMGLTYADIADLCFWSKDSVRDAVKYMDDNPSLRLRAEVIAQTVKEHLK